MLEKDRNILYGRDLYCRICRKPGDEEVTLQGVSFPEHDDVCAGGDVSDASHGMYGIKDITFPDYDDVGTIGISDFIYRSFRIEGESSDFLLYENVAFPDSEMSPVESIFHSDYSELDFIAQSARMEILSDLSKTRQPKKYSYSREIGKKGVFADNEFEVVSKSFTIPRKTERSCHIGVVKVALDSSGIYIIKAEVDYADFILNQIRKFFDLENVIVVRFDSKREESFSGFKSVKRIGKLYFFSVLRACMIALKACMKFSRPIVFEFIPICQMPQVDVERTSRIGKVISEGGNEKIQIQESCDVLVRASDCNIFRKELLFNIIGALLPMYPIGYLKMNITIDGCGKSYSLDPGVIIYGKLLSQSMSYQNMIAEKVGYDYVISGLSDKDYILGTGNVKIPDDDIKKLYDVFDDCQFQYKRLIYHRDSGLIGELSTARRFARNIACAISYSKQGALDSNRIPSFDQVCSVEKGGGFYSMRGLTMFICEYNPYHKRFFRMSMLVTIGEESDESAEKMKLIGALKEAMRRHGISCGRDFEDRKVDMRFVRSKSRFNSGSVVEPFVSYIRRLMDNED